MRKLGQHFLINQKIADKIVGALEINPGERIIEIGPGKGILTDLLVSKVEKAGASLIAIEKDRRLGLKLYQKYKDFKNVEIQAGDILEELSKLAEGPLPYRLISNLPYYISGKLLRSVSELKHKPIQSVFMFQKEVAQRLSAKEPKMNLLAASVQIWAQTKLLFSVGPENFSPPPQIESAVVDLHLNPGIDFNEEEYFYFIHKAFKHPRKLLLNNLRENSEISREELLKLFKEEDLPENVRAQELSIDILKKLSLKYTLLLS